MNLLIDIFTTDREDRMMIIRRLCHIMWSRELHNQPPKTLMWVKVGSEFYVVVTMYVGKYGTHLKATRYVNACGLHS